MTFLVFNDCVFVEHLLQSVKQHALCVCAFINVYICTISNITILINYLSEREALVSIFPISIMCKIGV